MSSGSLLPAAGSPARLQTGMILFFCMQADNNELPRRKRPHRSPELERGLRGPPVKNIPAADMPRLLYDCILDLQKWQEKTRGLLEEIEALQTRTEQYREGSVQRRSNNRIVLAANRPILTAEDWQEIYYALKSKLAGPTTQGDDSVGSEWRVHLQHIIDTIGPDGVAMYPDGESPGEQVGGTP